MVLIAGLLVLLALTILSMGSMMSTSMELKIASNDRSAKEAFYLAEAGTEDGRSRLQASSPSPVVDDHPTSTDWRAFIGTEDKSRSKGYQSTNSNHVRYDPLNPPDLNYVVTVAHKADGSGNILKWGDSNNDGKPEENATEGNRIYVLTSEGYTPTGATKTVRTETARVAPITVPSALYTKARTTIQGSSTHVIGMDGCGGNNVAGITSQQEVDLNGGPTITGWPTPIVQLSSMNIDVQYLVEQFKKLANYPYSVNAATFTGMNWGSPVPGAFQQSPSSCTSHNIVFIDTHSTYIRLSGESSGCGLLLVQGDLSVQGGFQWYGVILVTGSITMVGGGGKNVTGGVLAGGSLAADLIGGDANIVYCSQAVNNQTNYLPLVTLRWAELFR